MSDKLIKALDNIMKKHGKGSVVVGDESIEYKRISTGSLGLDIITGGGYPEGKHVEIMAPESSGKAQPLTSKILTPNGWVNMGDLKLGSIISNTNGLTQEVIGIFPQGIQDVYELTLDDGSSMKCTKDHLFTVQSRDSELYETLALSEIIENGLVFNNQTRKYKLPGIKPIEFSKKELTLNPYILGFILGDDCFSNKSFSTGDHEIIEVFNEIINAENYDLEIYKVDNSEYDYRYCKRSSKKGKKNIICEALNNYGLLDKKSHTKFIPECYLYSDISSRLELLRGLMDSDGTIDKNGNSLSYTSTSIKLAENVRDLFRSFGFRAIISDRNTQFKNKFGIKTLGKKAYTVSVISDSDLINPFKLSRKAKRYESIRSDKKKYGFRYIAKIEKVGEEECQCIKVSSADQLYITDNYIVTHNTTVAIYGMIQAQKKYPNKRVVMIDAEHAFDRDYAEALGLKMEEVLIVQPDNGEQGLEIADELIDSGEISFITIDSIAALTPKAEIDGEMGESKMGLHARLMSQAFRKLTAKSNKTGTVVFWTNQLREKIGIMFGNPETTTGGNAAKFYASIRIDLRKKQGDKDSEGDIINSKVTAKTIKNKTAPPFRKCEFDIIFGEGIDFTSEILYYGEKAGIIQKSGSWYSYNETKLGQGGQGVKSILKDNPELVEELETKIRQHYNI